jgi:DNA-binding winged helix-turn-helix (wHTH) protein/TolB-like protein
MARDLYEFGPFQLDPEGRRLLRHGEVVSITPKAFDTLTRLVLRQGQVFSREELIAQIWPDTTVGEYSLNQCIAVLRKALDDNSRRPAYIATLPGRGYAFIAEVQKISVTNGNGTASEPPAPARAELGQGPDQEQNSDRSANLWRIAFALAAVAAIMVSSLWFLFWHLSSASATHKVKARPSVAVLPLKNLAGRADAAWLSTALPEMLSTELESSRELRVVAREDARSPNASLPDSPPEDWKQKSRRLGADFLVTGGYTVLPQSGSAGERVRIDLTIRSAATGETVASTSQEGTVQDLFALLSRSGAELRHDLGAGPVSEVAEQQARATVPSNVEAAWLYASGLDKLRSTDPVAARQLLERAVASDPSFPLAHLALADAWHALGYQANEAAEARRAWELSSPLSRENQLRLEAHYLQTIPDWDKAIIDYRSLSTFYPDNIDYGLGLMGALNGAGKAREALTEVDTLRNLPLQSIDLARLDFAEALSQGALSDYKQAAAAADRAAQIAQTLGASWLATRALLYEAGALGSAAVPQAATVRNKVRALCEASGDRACKAVIYRWRGIETVNSDPDESERSFRAALDIAREIGSRSEEENDLNGLAAVATGRGDFRTADRMYEDLLTSARQRQNKWSIQMAANNLGYDLLLEARLPEAQQAEEEALAVSRESGQKIGMADALIVLARILELRGDLDGARKDYEEARADYISVGNDETTAPAESGLGDLLRDRNDLAGARDKHQRALKYFSHAGDAASAANEELALAQLSLDERRFDDAAQMARKAADDFHAAKHYDEEALAQSLLAQASATQGRADEARKASQRAETIISQGQAQLLRLQVELAEEIAAAALGGKKHTRPAEASRLQAIARDARAHGIVRVDLEARLARGSISGATGAHALAEVQNEASKDGYLLIATRAEAARMQR